MFNIFKKQFSPILILSIYRDASPILADLLYNSHKNFIFLLHYRNQLLGLCLFLHEKERCLNSNLRKECFNRQIDRSE